MILVKTLSFFRPGSNTDLPSFAFLPVDRDSEAYNMNHIKRGKACIFNHENFNPNLDLKPRAGTAKDRDNLYMRLRELDFDVTYFNDLTFNELNTEIMKCKYSPYYRIISSSFHWFFISQWLVRIIQTMTVSLLHWCLMEMMAYCMPKTNNTNLKNCGPTLHLTSVPHWLENPNCFSFK